MTSFILTVAPATEPVLLADAKAQARIDTTADDTLVTSLITAARQWVENYTNRALIAQTWQLWMDMWPCLPEPWWDGVREAPVSLSNAGFISLPRPPLISVNAVQTFDNSDNATIWPASNYYVDTIRAPGRLALRMGSMWPLPTRTANGIMIEYIAGYGSNAAAVPEQIKTAIRQIVSHWYENRGEASTAPTARGSVTVPSVPVPLVIQALLDPYRVRTK